MATRSRVQRVTKELRDGLKSLEWRFMTIADYRATVKAGQLVDQPTLCAEFPVTVNDRLAEREFPDHPLAMGNESVRMKAADLFAAYHNPLPQKVLDTLHIHLFDCSASVRQSLATALLFSGNLTSIQKLEQLLEVEDESNIVRKWARIAIDSLRFKYVDREPAMKSKVTALYNQWAEEFTKQRRREKRSAHRNEERASVKDQIEFIGSYLGFALLDGESHQNLQRIEWFLSIQTEGLQEDRLQLRFVGGRLNNVVVVIKYLDDIDVENIHDTIGFQEIVVLRGDSETWTDESAEQFMNGLEEDLSFDGQEVTLWCECEGSKLTVFCYIRDEDEDDCET